MKQNLIFQNWKKIAEALEVDLIELIPLEGKNVYLFSHFNNGDGCHIFNSEAEVVFENEKLQLMLELKDKELAMQQREIENLKVQIVQLQDIVRLLKAKNGD